MRKSYMWWEAQSISYLPRNMKTFQDFANGHKLLDHQPYFNPFSASPPNSLKWGAKLCCSSQDVYHASASFPQLYLSSNPSSYLHFPSSLKPQAVKPAGIPLLKTLICPSSSMLLVILLALSWWGISEKFLLIFQHCKEETKTCFLFTSHGYPVLLLPVFRQLELHNLLGNYLFPVCLLY